MNKNNLKYFIDVGLLISALIVIITGIIKFRSFLGLIGINLNYDLMNMGLYRILHDWSGLAMTVLVIIHLILNWDWIIATTKCIFSKEDN
jgi:hypothetical protein